MQSTDVMASPVENPFPQPERQSPAAALFLLGNVLQALLRQLWVLILVVLFNPKKQSAGGFSSLFAVILVFATINALIRYLFQRFYIRDGELVLESGLFRKSRLNVPLDRIQSVNFRQGILHRLLSVVAVDIDTAGSSGHEFSLQAITHEKAGALRLFVESQKAASSEPVFDAAESDEALPPSPEFKIYGLGASDLFKIGLSQNHLRTAGIILAFLASFADDLAEALDVDVYKQTKHWLADDSSMAVLYILLSLLPLLLFFSLLFTMVRTWLAHYDMQLWRTSRGYKLVAGLFTRREVLVALEKIQWIDWRSSPLLRHFGFVSVRLPQAASQVSQKQIAARLPGCSHQDLAIIRNDYMPGELLHDFTSHGVDRRIIFRRFFQQGLLPVLVGALAIQILSPLFFYLILIWLPISLWLAVRYHKTWRWEVSEAGLRVAWGVIQRRTVLLNWHKVQSIRLSQSFFLRKAGLVHLTFATAAGDVRLPYIPAEEAGELRDFVLFKMETSDKNWM
jgi:putative membrane protein